MNTGANFFYGKKGDDSMETAAVTVEAHGRRDLADWSTYLDLWFNQELPAPLIEAVQRGAQLTLTFQLSPKTYGIVA